MLRPFFSYYGGKWRIAPKYPPPRYDVIVEPFAGSAGYALRYPEREVVLVEKYAPLAAAWRWLIAAAPSDVLALPDLSPGQRVADLDVPAGARALIGYWVNGACAMPHQTPGKWMRSLLDGSHREKWNNHPMFWSARLRDRIACQVEQIRHWRVIAGDYTEAPDVAATWFIDPPYSTRVGRRYPCSTVDYAALAAWAKCRHGQVIVCGADGEDWLPFQKLATVKSQRVDRRYCHEAVWLRETVS